MLEVSGSKLLGRGGCWDRARDVEVIRDREVLRGSTLVEEAGGRHWLVECNTATKAPNIMEIHSFGNVGHLLAA